MLKVQIIGNIGSDPELRYSPSGSPFLRFNVASNGRVRTPEGEWRDETTWIRCTVFGQRAEALSQYIRKGARVYVSGRLEARPWTDRENQARAGLEILADGWSSSHRDRRMVTTRRSTLPSPTNGATDAGCPSRWRWPALVAQDGSPIETATSKSQRSEED